MLTIFIVKVEICTFKTAVIIHYHNLYIVKEKNNPKEGPTYVFFSTLGTLGTCVGESLLDSENMKTAVTYQRPGSKIRFS